MNPALYGSSDGAAEKVCALLPGVVEKVGNLLNVDREELLETFSARAKNIEKSLAGEIMKTGFGDGRGYPEVACNTVAGEIMDTIAPKAFLIGHSAGGFVAHTIFHNPTQGVSDGNKFAYDAGNGVAKVILLAAPVGRGMPQPMPEGIANWGFELMDRHILQKMENLPGMNYAFVMIPGAAMLYSINKALTKEAYREAMMMTGTLTNPITYAMNPGFGQVGEGTDFVDKYVAGKRVPPGSTEIAVYTPEDGMMPPRTSMIDDSQANAFNLKVDVPVTEEDLKKSWKVTESILKHTKMSKHPFEHRKEFHKQILENPKHMIKLLDNRNYEGVRWECVNFIADMAKVDPALFERPGFNEVIEKLKEVAAERLPFGDSPSYMANQLLAGIGK